MFAWHHVLWVYAFLFSWTPTCSPSSSLTFNLSPPSIDSPHQFHCVWLLVIIIAAVNHLCCPALFGSTISNSGSPEITLFFPVCQTSLLVSIFSPTTLSPLDLVSPPSLASPSLGCQVCVCVCVFCGVGAFSGKQGLFCVYALMYEDMGAVGGWGSCPSVRSNLYPLIP